MCENCVVTICVIARFNRGNEMKKYFLLAALLPTFALASDWQFGGVFPNGSWSYDSASVIRVGTYRKAWLRYEYTETQISTNFPPVSYRSSKDLEFYDCANRKRVTTQHHTYDGVLGTGTMTYSANVQFSERAMADVIPDTVGEFMLDVVCRAKAR